MTRRGCPVGSNPADDVLERERHVIAWPSGCQEPFRLPPTVLRAAGAAPPIVVNAPLLLKLAIAPIVVLKPPMLNEEPPVTACGGGAVPPLIRLVTFMENLDSGNEPNRNTFERFAPAEAKRGRDR